jgi:tetratricopeptide (TPR) repeat protein
MTDARGGAALAHAAQGLIDRGDPAGALALLDSAGGVPDADILAARASAHLAQGDGEAALGPSRAALRLDPGHPAAAFNEGRALVLLGEPEAAATAFEIAARAFPQVAEIAARQGEAAYLAGDDRRAEAAFRRALALAPGHAAAFHLMTEFLHQQADQSALEQLLQEAVRLGAAPAYRAASAFARLGRPQEALAALAVAERSSGPAAPIEMLAADLLRETGDIAAAMSRARAAASLAPGDAGANAPLARLLLATGAAAEAEALARQMLRAAPDHQLWLAFLWTALASGGSAEAGDLLDFERDIAVLDLQAPPGFSSLGSFNAALASELAPYHKSSGAPLGQSVHGGSQTRRPLQTLKSPALSAFFALSKRAIELFAASLPEDQAHPFHRSRRARLRLSGAWSVSLAPGGRHGAHVHPGGWISSAYYVDLPSQMDRESEGAGWLSLGLPPFPVPNIAAPRRLVEPRPGRLALFPSYCWHGTAPFASEGRRLTIAFDAAPY